MDLCKQDELEAPEFNEYSGGFSVTFKLKQPIGVVAEAIEAPRLSDRKKTILDLLNEQTGTTLADIMAQLINPPSDRMVRKDLNVLKTAGLIERDGHTRGSKWIKSKN